jgi:hypothetical protein
MIFIASTLSDSHTLRAAEDLNKIHALATKEWARESIEYNIKRLEYLLPFQERWGSAERIAELIRQGGATSDIISDDQIDSLAASAENFVGDPIARLTVFEVFQAIGQRAKRSAAAMERIYVYEFCHTKIPANYNINNHFFIGELSRYPPSEMAEIFEKINGSPPPRPDCEPPR